MKQTTIFSICFLLLASFVARAQAQTETLELWGHDLEMTADGTTTTHLTISERDVVDYTAFNMTIMVPKGIHVAKVRSGRDYVDDIALNVDRATTTHTIACNMPEYDYIKVACYSSKSQDLYPDDIDGNPVTELFTIGLTADPTMANGEYEVRIIEVKFVKAAGGASVPQQPVTMKMNVTGGVDGKSISCTIGETGLGTLILPYGAHVPSALQAFGCAALDGTQLVTTPLVRIPALTPVLLQGEPGTYTFTGVPETTGETSFTEGLLTGVLENTDITAGYVLQEQGGNAAFYPVNPESPITVPAHKCYLNYTGPQMVIHWGGGITGVDALQQEQHKASPLYDLNGRNVVTPPTSGVYIQGNQKVFLKK